MVAWSGPDRLGSLPLVVAGGLRGCRRLGSAIIDGCAAPHIVDLVDELLAAVARMADKGGGLLQVVGVTVWGRAAWRLDGRQALLGHAATALMILIRVLLAMHGCGHRASLTALCRRRIDIVVIIMVVISILVC